MTKLPFSRALLAAAMASTLALTGCDIEDPSPQPVSDACSVLEIAGDACPDVIDDPVPGYYQPGTHPRFTPAASDLPLNTDILFSGTTDGTASLADPENAVEAAINKIDGWSVSAAFDIAYNDSIDDDSIDANPLSPTANVFVLPLDTSGGDGDPLNPDNIVGVQDFISDPSLYPSLEPMVVTLDGVADSVLRLAPTRPLASATKYLVFTTNGILDGAGDPTTASASYELLGVGDGDACEANGVTSALLPICDAIGGWEYVAAQWLAGRNAFLNGAYMLSLPTNPAVIAQSITISYTFTTTDTFSPLVAMGAPRAALVQAQVDLGLPQNTAISNVATLLSTPGAPALPTPSPRDVSISALTATDLNVPTGLPANVGNLYTGTIELPYYQSAPADADDTAFFGEHWNADVALGAALSNALGEPGAFPPQDNDDSYNVTWRFPFAGKTTDLTVPLQVTLPDAGCPGSGCPVAIYIHGITSDRASVVALAHTLASQGVATVAIDLPMHGIAANSPFYDPAGNTALGLNIEANPNLAALYPDARERHFNQRFDSDNGVPVPMDFTAQSALDGSGSLFINLTNFLNTRDNLKQAVTDLLNLNASLENISEELVDNGIDANGLRLDRVYVVGVSLGGIIGSVYTAVNQYAYAADAQVYGGLVMAASPAAPLFAPTLTPIKGLVASVPGGQLTKVLENSVAFSAQILPGLADNGVEQGTSTFEKFMYVFQGIVDSADPVNFVNLLQSDTLVDNGLEVPVLIQEIVGGANLGDGTYLPDLVVPNNAYPVALGDAIPAPLAGTDPLVALLDIDILGTALADGVVNVRSEGAVVSRLSIGNHSSLLTTAGSAPVNGNGLATLEMQTQVASFIASNASSTAIGTANTGAAAPYVTAFGTSSAAP